METIRSTGSSNSSQPCRRTSTVRDVEMSASIALLYSHWLRLNVMPMTLTSYFCDGELQCTAPTASDVEQRHPGLEAQVCPSARSNFATCASSECHVVALVVAAGVAHCPAQEEREEVVRYVVDRLRFFVVRRQDRMSTSDMRRLTFVSSHG